MASQVGAGCQLSLGLRFHICKMGLFISTAAGPGVVEEKKAISGPTFFLTTPKGTGQRSKAREVHFALCGSPG